MPDEASFCMNCGTPANSPGEGQTYDQTSRAIVYNRKDPAIAAILSFLITGIGHLYIGKIGKGLLLLFAVIIITPFSLIPFVATGGVSGAPLVIVAMLIVFVIWIYAIYSAYEDAKEYNRLLESTGRPPW